MDQTTDIRMLNEVAVKDWLFMHTTAKLPIEGVTGPFPHILNGTEMKDITVAWKCPQTGDQIKILWG